MKDFIKMIIYNFFTIFPIKKNKIICNNFLSKGFGDNPKYIALELLKEKKNYDIVWVCQKIYNDTIPSKIRSVNSTIKYLYEFATARVWISNVRLPKYLKKRKSQYYIQTWHGGLAFKRIEKDVADSLSKKYIDMAKHDSKQIDLLISNSKFQTEIYKSSFWCDADVLEIGCPRNDILVKGNTKIRNNLKKILNLNGYNVLLYAPTFRKEENKENYNIGAEELLKLLEKKTNKEWKILVKFHPNVINPEEYFDFNDNIINISYYNDITELFFITDILITDYSSCAFDYMLLNKPIFLYTKDLKSYLKERNFYINVKETPFPIALNTTELLENIDSYIDHNFELDYKEFMNKYDLKEDGNSSKEIIKVINALDGDKNEI